MIKLLFFFGINLFITKTFCAIYETLPKGINMFVLKHVETSDIKSKYGANHREEFLSIKENLNSARLENINGAINTYFSELKKISKEAYDKFSLGEFQAKADIKIKVQGIGIARGITDQLTFFGNIPFYHIKSNVIFNQNKRSNLDEVSSSIKDVGVSSSLSNYIKQLTLQLPETNERLMQSLIMNYYGYQALGKWEKDTIGDAELGILYRLNDSKDSGTGISLGVVLPTGSIDNPDSLQDISTGDGQYDIFIEPVMGVSLFNNLIGIDLKTRLTYQFSKNKTIRTTTDPDFPLTRNKDIISEKLGNKIDASASITYNTTSWLNFNATIILNETGASTYKTTDLKVKEILEKNSTTSNRWERLGVGFSSLELYKSKKMDIPFEINLSAQKLISAKNSPNYKRYDLDFRFYF